MCRDDVRYVLRRDLCCWSECAWIEVQQSSSRRSLLIGCYYRPPKSAAAEVDAFVEALESTFSRINLSSTDVVLLGDFNATSSTWCALGDTSDAG